MNQLQEHYDSITAYHNTEKFSYNQAIDQDHEMKSQEFDYNIKKSEQIEIDKNFFISHANIIEIICQNCKLVFTFNNQLHQHFRLENCEKISKNNKKQQNSTALINLFIKFSQSNTISFNHNNFIILNICKILQDYKIHKQLFSAQIKKKIVFQKFYYITCKIFLKFNNLFKLICLNSECIMIISNHN